MEPATQTRVMPCCDHPLRRQRMQMLSLLCSAWVSGCASRQVTGPLVPLLLPSPKPPILWLEPFDELNPSQWHNVEVRGHTEYHVVELDGSRCLKAYSRAGASILLKTVRFNPDTYEWLSWRWRVDQLVQGEDLTRKEGSDAAARVYVYFDTKGLPWQKRSLDYVWSASLPVGTILESAYSHSSKMIVVESGASQLRQWRTVERNLEDDYKRCFGESPPDVIAIGVMNDTDNTGHEALAYFDDVRVSLSIPRTDSQQAAR